MNSNNYKTTVFIIQIKLGTILFSPMISMKVKTITKSEKINEFKNRPIHHPNQIWNQPLSYYFDQWSPWRVKNDHVIKSGKINELIL